MHASGDITLNQFWGASTGLQHFPFLINLNTFGWCSVCRNIFNVLLSQASLTWAFNKLTFFDTILFNFALCPRPYRVRYKAVSANLHCLLGLFCTRQVAAPCQHLKIALSAPLGLQLLIVGVRLTRDKKQTMGRYSEALVKLNQ